MMLSPLESPNSPPQSPNFTLTSSHQMLHKNYAARHLPPYHNITHPVLLENSGIQPIGNGHQFSFTPSNTFAQLSPRTSSEESDDEDDEREDETEDDDDDNNEEAIERESDSESDSSVSDSDPGTIPHASEFLRESHPTSMPATPTTSALRRTLTIEEMSDFDPMDQDRTGTIAPSGFSSPASARSRSRAPASIAHPTELPHGLTRDMRNLNCFASDSDSSEDVDTEEAAHQEFIRKQRELHMLRRRSHGSSIGKRTISERSDSDHEDWTPLDPDAVGSSARRLRRRMGDASVRRSFIQLQFQDPPPERIDEVDEPESEVEGIVFCDNETLAKELPYWMEYESPSP